MTDVCVYLIGLDKIDKPVLTEEQRISSVQQNFEPLYIYMVAIQFARSRILLMKNIASMT